MALAIPRLRHHYEVEKELAGRLRGAGLVRALEGALLPPSNRTRDVSRPRRAPARRDRGAGPRLAASCIDLSFHRSLLEPAAGERIANFNDSYARPDVGAHQSGSPPMQFGVDAYRAPPPRGF